MAGSTGRTTGIQTKWYYSETVPTTALTAYATWTGAGNLVLPANQIKFAVGDVDIGTEEASNTEAIYGEQTEYEYAIPGTPSTFSLEVEHDDGDRIHKGIHDAEAGTDCVVAAEVTTGTNAITLYIITGELKATKQSFSPTGLQKMTIPVAVGSIRTVREGDS